MLGGSLDETVQPVHVSDKNIKILQISNCICILVVKCITSAGLAMMRIGLAHGVMNLDNTSIWLGDLWVTSSRPVGGLIFFKPSPGRPQ